MDAAVSSSLRLVVLEIFRRGSHGRINDYDEHSWLVVVYLPTPLKNDGVRQ